MKGRKTKKGMAKAIDTKDRETLRVFIDSNKTEETIVYTDEHRSYHHLNRNHHCILHHRNQYVDGELHTNGIESF